MFPTISAPFEAKAAANGVAPELGFTVIVPSSPPRPTGNTSILFVALSITARNRPLGLKASEVGLVAVPLRLRVELGIWARPPRGPHGNR